MVNYSVDTNSRHYVYFLIAAVALIVSFLAGPLVESAQARWLAPSAFSLFGMLLFWFEHYGWRTRWVASLFGVPDLRGKYVGTVEFDRDTPKHKSYTVEVSISQTWSKIEMYLDSGDTISHLRTCGFFVASGIKPSLLYTYSMSSRDAPGDRSKYGEGTAEMYVSDEGGKVRLFGRTYSTKERTGLVTLTRLEPARGALPSTDGAEMPATSHESAKPVDPGSAAP